MSRHFKKLGIQALVFDFDGTLARQTLDFAVMRQEAVAAMAKHVAVPERLDLPTMELLALIGVETEAARAARRSALEAVRRVEVEAARGSSLFPYVRPMLARLETLGLGMAVITRNCFEAVSTVFPDVAQHCRLLTRDDVANVKPDPEHLEKALAILDCKPENALMIGDHPMDIEVGKRAGTKTAGVATGGHSREQLAAHSPDFVANGGEELMRMLNIL